MKLRDSLTVSIVVMASSLLPVEVSTFLQDWKAKRRNFSILVIGDCGSGKTTLVNNLLGEEIAEEESSSTISTYQGQIRNVPVTVHETSGFENADGREEADFENAMRSLLTGGKLDVIVYCFKATETRMRDSIVTALKTYYNMGLNWRKTVIALTFADVLPIPKHARTDPSYDQARYFDSCVAEWKRKITETLIKRIGVPTEIAAGLKVTPTAGDVEDELPNRKQWFGSMWSLVIDVAHTEPSSSSRSNIQPDRPRPSAMHSAPQPQARMKSSSSQPSRHQVPPRNEGFGSRDGLLTPSSQRDNETRCNGECVCSCFKAVVGGFVSCIVASCTACANFCSAVYHALCRPRT